MKFFTSVLEAKQKERIIDITDLKEYYNKYSKVLPQDINNALLYSIKYKITNSTDIEEFINASKAKIKTLAEKWGMNENEVKDFSKIISGLGVAKKQLPFFQSTREFNSIMSGKKQLEDLSLDLSTERGRAAAVKQYMPLIQKIVHQYEGKSSFSREELLSSALEGFTLAMNDYHSPDENYIDTGDTEIDMAEAIKQKALSFKQYAAYRIKYKILDDMNNLSRTVRLPKGQIKKNNETDPSANFNSKSIDLMMSDDPDVVSQADRMKELSEKPEGMKPNEEKSWKKIFAIIDKKFNVKQASIFYKVFGLNGFEKQTGVEVAKELGCTKSYISKVVKQVTTFLRDDPRSSEILQELQDLYTESLILKNYDRGNINLMEVLTQDDIYMLLTEMNRWTKPGSLNQDIDIILNEYDFASRDFINNCLEKGFEYLDANYRKNKKLIVHFLEGLYPTESFAKKSDVYILEVFNDIINQVNKK